MDNKPAVSSIPALKTTKGDWIFEPKTKANIFSETFSSKYELIQEEENEYTEICASDVQQTSGPLPSEEDAAKILCALRIDSATGPDLLSTRMLRECAGQIAKPFRTLAKSILHYKTWPRPWMVHWIVPLYKKGSTFIPGNYRGIHLTPQISKAMERFLGSMISTYVSLPACVGPNQFAYQKARGARDALAFMALTWISGFNNKLKFSIYCSDVSSAFDRVSRRRLVAKLRAKGISEEFIAIFDAWLQEREARVAVGGQYGDPMRLRNMIYQGTVWGPWLWNIFYEDARLALQVCEFREIVFADDLNAYRSFPIATPTENLIAEAKTCQKELHKWGRANQVQFDPGKESIHVVSHHAPAGNNFKILGLDFDCRLVMGDAICGLTSEMRWRVRSILRAQRYHTTANMLHLYKAKVLSYAEYRTAAIYHASGTLLQQVDRVQESFLEDVGIDAISAFLVFNLAPLSLRRNIAMLGLIHRTVLGHGPEHFKQWFYREDVVNRTTTRFKRHRFRLHEYIDGLQLAVVKRSALGLVSIYNMLPAEIMEAKTVKCFQGLLQDLAKDCASRSLPQCDSIYSTRHMLHAHPLRAFAS